MNHSTPPKQPKLSPPLSISLAYLLFGLLWIFFSDRIAASIAQSEKQLLLFSNLKGGLFIVVTAVLLYFLIRRKFSRLYSTLRQLEKTELKNRTNEIRFKNLLDNLPDLVWLKDPEGVFLNCNHRFEQFFGASEEAIKGKTDYDFVDKELADFFRKHDREVMNKKTPVINEEWVPFASDGHKELLETIKAPLYDETGELIGVLGIGRNITVRKQTEQELERFNKLATGRELRMIELKKEINTLCRELGKPEPYSL